MTGGGNVRENSPRFKEEGRRPNPLTLIENLLDEGSAASENHITSLRIASRARHTEAFTWERGLAEHENLLAQFR